MSRIGAKPIDIPSNVSVQCTGTEILLKTSKVERKLTLSYGVVAKTVNNQLLLSVDNEDGRPMYGTYRSNINSIISGMVKDFSVDLEISGVGYKADCDGKYLTLSLGYSHNVKYKIPLGIEIKVVKPTHLVVSGVDKQKVHMVASDICKIRKHDPYKGKGIVIKGKFMLRKVVSKKK